MGEVNRDRGLLHGPSQVCETVGKQRENYMSALQKLTESTKQQGTEQPSTQLARSTMGVILPFGIPVASLYKYLHLWTSILSRFWWNNFTHLEKNWLSLLA